MLEDFAEMFPDRPIYAISALGDIGLEDLVRDLMAFLTEEYLLARENENHAEQLEELEARITADVWAHSERMRARRAGEADESADDDLDDWDADDEDGEATEVIYVRE